MRDTFQLGNHTLHSRLIVGTGKYASYEQMQEALALSGTECITVAVRRERLVDKEGRNILDFIDLDRYVSAAQHGRLFQRGRCDSHGSLGP